MSARIDMVDMVIRSLAESVNGVNLVNQVDSLARVKCHNTYKCHIDTSAAAWQCHIIDDLGSDVAEQGPSTCSQHVRGGPNNQTTCLCSSPTRLGHMRGGL
ncbi:hypothetical protein LIER_05700 [Lithospermum erythrorhizon]|uniref:Uncharacterized protein n=1 Tax=Lithospermum erythrorhizon TaxID=34254 RepID=A0AAV3P1F3_LITER